jgi:hypothetical protein
LSRIVPNLLMFFCICDTYIPISDIHPSHSNRLLTFCAGTCVAFGQQTGCI